MYSDYGKATEPFERKVFQLSFWYDRYLRAKAYRMTCGWEKAAEEGLRIRNNDLPLRDMQAAPGWKGKFYKDNWLWKGIKWIVSMLTGSSVHVDLKALDGFGDEAMDIYETEVNYYIEQSRLVDILESCLYDRYYTGLGVSRGRWNVKRITPVNMTGSPSFEYVSPNDIFLDPHTRVKDKSDMRYFFHELQYDVEELRMTYPKYADLIESAIDEKRIDAMDTAKVVVLQYKKKVTREKIFITDTLSGVAESFNADEWYEMIEKVAADPQTIAMYQAGQQDIEYKDWLQSGLWLDEGLSVSPILQVEEPAVYQAIFMPDLNITLEYPQYIGQEWSYYFLIGYHNPDSAYPLGLAYYMADMQELSVIFMTVLSIQAVKLYKMEKLIQEGSLANEKDYKERGYELGINPIVKSDWQKAHPHTKAVEYLHLPEFPAYLMQLNESITHAQKTMTGAVDSAIGIAQYSGQSGIQVAQLQAASRVYQKEEIEGYRLFFQNSATWLKDMIALYRNYPHKIKGLTTDNAIGLVEVATSISNRLNADSYYVEVTIQESQEVVKQIERELYMSLKNDKMISPLEYMRALDIPNADKKFEEAQEYYGVLQYVQLLQEFPEVKDYIDQIIASQGQGQGQGNEQQIQPQ